MNRTEIREAYLNGKIQILSPYLKSLLKNNDILDIIVDIATIICNKYDKNICRVSELMTEATLALYLYSSKKCSSIFCNYDCFRQRINERLNKIVFVENTDQGSPSGKSMGRTIYLDSYLLGNDYDLLSIFTHEMTHILSSSDNYIGLIKCKMHGNSSLQKAIQESRSALNSYWYLNEMITEFIAASSLTNLFELPETDCSFKLDNGLEILIKNKCTSYKDIVHYIYPINYIFQNDLMTIYFSDVEGYRDLFKHKKHAQIKSLFRTFYTTLLLYNIHINRKSNNRYMKNQDVRSHKLFFSLQKRFNQLIAKFEEDANLSQNENIKFLSVLAESKIYIDGNPITLSNET